MGARKDAENNANVTRLHSVYVIASSLKTTIMSNKLIKYAAILVIFLSFAISIV